MWLATLLHSLPLALLEGLLLRHARRHPQRAGRLLAGVLGVVVLGLGAAVLLGEDGFGVLRLATWTLGIHLPALLAALALVLRRSARGWAVGLALTALLGAVLTTWALWVEPERLQITHHTLPIKGLTAPLRVVVVADLQTDHVGRYEERALREALDQHADVLLFAGDYIQQHDPARRAEERVALNALLRRLGASGRLGGVAVEGNMEAGDWATVFQGLPVDARTPSRTLQLGPLTVTALSLADSFNTRLVVPPAEGPHLVLGHAPDFALGHVDADVLVAGHTHGGQVQVPGLGPLVTLSAVSREQASGLTALPGGRWLLVSRGVGMERGYAPRLRLFCPPELVVLDLVPPGATTP